MHFTAEAITAELALAVSVVSLLVAWRALGIARQDLRTSRRSEVQTMLLGAEKLLVEHPELMRAFTSSEMGKPGDSMGIELKNKIDMMVLVYIDVFEIAYDVFHETGQDTRWESWQRTMKKFIEDCPSFPETWKFYGPEYDKPFREFIDKEIRHLPNATAAVCLRGRPLNWRRQPNEVRRISRGAFPVSVESTFSAAASSCVNGRRLLRALAKCLPQSVAQSASSP